jgi:poly-beta-hydroxyalkanoate depolymerase
VQKDMMAGMDPDPQSITFAVALATRPVLAAISLVAGFCSSIVPAATNIPHPLMVPRTPWNAWSEVHIS